jgi:hypothetical protein
MDDPPIYEQPTFDPTMMRLFREVLEEEHLSWEVRLLTYLPEQETSALTGWEIHFASSKDSEVSLQCKLWYPVKFTPEAIKEEVRKLVANAREHSEPK